MMVEANTSMSSVNVRLIGSKLMLGVDSQGYPVVLNNWSEREPVWEGLKPSDLLLLSAASCAMYDVVEILRKQREPLTGLEVLCKGDQIDEPPFTFVKIHLSYRIEGGVNPDKLVRAIDLAQNKYCSVLATLRPSVEISYDYQCLPEGKA